MPRPTTVAPSNPGFPEPEHNLTALAICKQFARISGFTWAGDLAPREALALLKRPIVPALAYMLMGDLGWLAQVRCSPALTHLTALSRQFEPGGAEGVTAQSLSPNKRKQVSEDKSFLSLPKHWNRHSCLD